MVSREPWVFFGTCAYIFVIFLSERLGGRRGNDHNSTRWILSAQTGAFLSILQIFAGVRFIGHLVGDTEYSRS